MSVLTGSRHRVSAANEVRQQMKILFFSPASAMYGSERSMLALLVGGTLAAEVVCPGGGELELALKQLGVPVHRQEFGKYSFRQNPLWHLRFLWRAYRFVFESKADAVVANLDGNTPLVALAAKLAGIPFIRFCRFELRAPPRPIDAWCWRSAAAIICPSETVRRQFLEWAGEDFAHRTHRMYEAYVRPSNDFRDETSSSTIPAQSELTIGCVGRIHRGKRIETAIEAVAVLRARGTNVRLEVIGAHDGSDDGLAYARELERLTTELGLGDSVAFLGYMSSAELEDALRRLSVLVLTSESESFGMVLMEAWAQGVPTVCSDIPACREITELSGGGLLARVGEPESFADRIAQIVTDPHLAATMRQAGREWVERECTALSYSHRFHQILQRARVIT